MGSQKSCRRKKIVSLSLPALHMHFEILVIFAPNKVHLVIHLFLQYQERSNRHLFSRHDNRHAHSDMGDLETYFGMVSCLRFKRHDNYIY